MNSDTITIKKKYIQNLVKFYSGGFIFSLGCVIVFCLWFCFEFIVYEIINDEVFWLGIVSLEFLFMCALGWQFIIDIENDTEEEETN